MSFFDSIMVLDWPVLAAGLAVIVFAVILIKRAVSRWFR